MRRDDWENLVSGADPGPGGLAYGEIDARQAGLIADKILSEPLPASGPADEWDHTRHSLSVEQAAREGNRRRPGAIPYGYGDPRVVP